MKRKICIVTGSRAEYGLLRPLLEEIRADKNLSLQLIVTGMHLSKEFGLTYKEIVKDKFKIDAKIKMLSNSDNSVDISKSMGVAMEPFAKAYKRLNPDIIVVLGDRFEILAAVTAAMICRIPMAHLNGGERTEGVIDEAIRHAITKMSHLHFTATREYRKRVIQLGESPKRVFNVGEVGLDNVKSLKLLSKKDVEKKTGIKFKERNILVTFHPVTLCGSSGKQFKEVLMALDQLKDTFIIFTKANADMGGRAINKMIDSYVSRNKDKSRAFVSMGQLLYLSTLRIVGAVVGNSSSGIVEAPSFHIGSINIGDRQKGRIIAKSVIHCKTTRAAIMQALKKLYSKSFQKELKGIKNPYGNGGSSVKVKNILKKVSLKNVLNKAFYDVEFEV